MAGEEGEGIPVKLLLGWKYERKHAFGYVDLFLRFGMLVEGAE